MPRILTIFLLLFISNGANALERLVLVGGAEYPPKAMKRFVEWAGGKESNILIVTWGGMGHVDGTRNRLKRHMSNQGALNFSFAPLPEEMETHRGVFESQLVNATGVFFTGGDQINIMTVIDKYNLRDALTAKFKAGTVFGGASAGTAIMSETMLTGNGESDVINPDKTETIQGLGLLKGMVVDQHFIERKRQNRLLSVLLQPDHTIGVGVDESSAISIEDSRRIEALGDSYNHIFVKASEKPFRFEVTLLSLGEVWKRDY